MISDMRKYSFVVFHAEYDDFLRRLKELGVLHIKTLEKEPTEEIEQTCRKINEIKQTKQTYGNAEIEQQKALISQLEKDIRAYEPWGGDADCERLKKNGIDVKLYQCPTANFNEEWTNDYVFKVNEINGITYFVAFNCAVDAEEITLPDVPYDKLLADKKEADKALAELIEKIQQTAPVALKELDEKIAELTNHLVDLQAQENTEDAVEGRLKVIEGYVPEEAKEALETMLRETSIVYVSDVARAEDCPPIKLKNSAFSKLFEPITEMFSLPNYSEIDPTPLFAPFFMLFFGLCLGDAGYGLLVFIATAVARSKVSDNMKGFCSLGMILGGITIVVSLITGVVFGVDLSDPEIGVPESIRQYFVTDRNFKIAGYSPMMVFAVVIGLVQILFGMCINAAKITKQSGAKNAISTISWIIVLPTLAVTFGLPSVGITLPEVVTYVLYGVIGICCIGIYFLNSPVKGVGSIFSNLGSGIWATYNMATGLLGDTLSYIRLFALGLTGGILGSVFNSMAFQAGDGLPWYSKFIVVLLILLIGHAINFGLCLIGAFVHPMRLTFVEFYKNAGFEGGGKEYKPYKKIS